MSSRNRHRRPASRRGPRQGRRRASRAPTVRAPRAPAVAAARLVGMREQPVWARVVWAGLGVCVIALAVHAVSEVGGTRVHDLLDNWISNGAELVAAIMCFVGASRKEQRRARAVWACFGSAMVMWFIGDALWSLNGDHTSLTSVSDVFWLAWYPLVLTGLAFLVRAR